MDHPTAPCGQNPWYCPYDSADPNCCQQQARERMEKRSMTNKEIERMLQTHQRLVNEAVAAEIRKEKL